LRRVISFGCLWKASIFIGLQPSYPTSRLCFPHEKSVAVSKKSQLLLLIEIDSEETHRDYPGKVYEIIMAAKKTYIGVAPNPLVR